MAEGAGFSDDTLPEGGHAPVDVHAAGAVFAFHADEYAGGIAEGGVGDVPEFLEEVDHPGQVDGGAACGCRDDVAVGGVEGLLGGRVHGGHATTGVAGEDSLGSVEAKDGGSGGGVNSIQDDAPAHDIGAVFAVHAEEVGEDDGPSVLQIAEGFFVGAFVVFGVDGAVFGVEGEAGLAGAAEGVNHVVDDDDGGARLHLCGEDDGSGAGDRHIEGVA